MVPSLSTLLNTLAVGMAAATPIKTRQAAPDAHRLVIGAPFQILTADFTRTGHDGPSFTITGNSTTEGNAPSWMVFEEPNRLYTVNENANDTSLYLLDGSKANPTLSTASNGTSGVVSLDFNADRTRLLGGSFGNGQIDVWDISAEDGSLKLLQQLQLEGELGPEAMQTAHRAHEVVLDPTGQFFAVPNLGGDTIAVVDARDGEFKIAGYVDQPSGSGPRHGKFIVADGGPEATHYALACELSNEMVLFSLAYTQTTIEFTEVQRQSSFGPGNRPANATTAAAGELQVGENKHVYISNRLTGDVGGDSIAHFTLQGDVLVYMQTTKTQGVLPRMFSLSKDGSVVFVANQAGDWGLVAFNRCVGSGKIDQEPLAQVPNEELVAPVLAGQANLGPTFIQEI